MAEDAPKAPLPESVPASVHILDGAADPATTTQAQTLNLQPSSAPPPAQDVDGDTQMTSSTRTTLPNPTTTTQGAPPTPDASPRAPFAAVPSGPVPLDSPLRTVPMHPSLPSVKLPDSSPANINPVTLQPFTEVELQKYGYEKLRAQIFATHHNTNSGEGVLSAAQKAEIARLREETASALKQRLDEREARIREIEREMEDKEKIREVERKVFRKKLAGGGKGV